jgi:hypothetical protein
MHSTGTIASLRQRTARPANSGGTSVAERTWFGALPVSLPSLNLITK